MSTVICEILLCTDCTMLHANGEVSPDRDVTQPYPLSALRPNESITLGDEVIDFSSSRCDGCNTGLAGYRHCATLWED